MDVQPTYDNFPWDLIGSALQGTLSPDEDLQFRQWLGLSPDNQQKYDRLQQTWKDGLADYIYYQAADESKAWEAIRARIADKGVIGASFGKKTPVINRWAVAAAILLFVGAGWWYLARKDASILYETALNEQKKISLPDGSTLILSAQTHIQLDPGFNKLGRTVMLAAGEAHFDVSHQPELPFIVEMDAVRVKDIGTNFTIRKTPDSIKVTVSGGKVAFIIKETGESRELTAGSTLTFYVTEHRFGDIKAADPADKGAGSLRFDNSPLSDVITALQKTSGKKISLNDSLLGQKRLTVHLDGESFDNAIEIICASLDLEYAEKDGGYILKSKNPAAHN
ncbi:MAG TPA: FecR domain-containing protein, partial [Puia sp.]|nr:FecR domain-containing protein [Puia sp.]